jgi:hypothetical protein
MVLFIDSNDNEYICGYEVSSYHHSAHENNEAVIELFMIVVVNGKIKDN